MNDIRDVLRDMVRESGVLIPGDYKRTETDLECRARIQQWITCTLSLTPAHEIPSGGYPISGDMIARIRARSK